MKLAWIIDDDDEMLHAVKLMLQLLRYRVEIFREARSAVSELNEGVRPHVIVLDNKMPEVSGLDMLEFLRLREQLRSIPVVMLSTESADSRVDEAMEKGADAYIFKPVTLEELERVIAQAVQARKAH
jgi:two-component system chemotaxis response regulator CheY